MFSKQQNALSRMIAVIVILLSSIVMMSAQPGRNMKMTVTGYIIDSKTSEPLIAATVQANSSDGGSGTFGITDENGKFSFEINRPGKYQLIFKYVGYKDLTKDVNIMPNRTNIGKFKLTEDPRLLKEVEAVGHADRIKQKGDTLAYNAAAFKVQDGATAEELIAKMPGIEVTSSGVKAQGESVQKILVDGKEFFDNDLKMALRTLPAEVVESVNVFDKKSDQAEFTGIDDGETVKAMDFMTKSFSRNGVFGKVFAGGGNNFNWNNAYWNTGFNLNLFNGDRRISLLGMSNNTNVRDFSTDDMESGGGMMMGRMWGAQGVARTNGLGVNYSDVFMGGRLNVELSYFFNQSRTVTADTTYTDDLNYDNASYSRSNSLAHSMSHRIGGRVSFRPTANDEIMFRPNINIQSNESTSDTESRRWSDKLDNVMSSDALWDEFLSRNITNGNTESDSWNLRGNLLWRHRFSKAGRTLSLNMNMGASGNDNISKNNKVYDIASVSGLVTTKQFMYNDGKTNNSNLGGNIQWTEPLNDRTTLSLRYEIGYNYSKRDNAIDYYTDDSYKSLDHHDENNTNTYEQKSLNNSGELGVNYHVNTLRINATVRAQESHIEGEQDYYLLANSANSFSTTKNYFSVLPNLRVQYRTEKGTQFQFDYRARTQNPNVRNLQESVNTTNAQAYSTGNPDLDQSRSHSLNLRMIYANAEHATNFMIFGGFDFTQKSTSNQVLRNLTKETVAFTSLDPKYGFDKDVFKPLSLIPGASITRPINLDGNKSAHMAMVFGFPFDLIYSNVNVSLDGNYSTSPSSKMTITGFDTNNNPIIDNLNNKTRQIGFGPRMNINSNISSDLNFNIMYSPQWSWVKDSEVTGDAANSRDYVTHNLNANLNWTFWRGFTTEQSLNYSYYGGPSMPESIDQWIWNASLGKKFLKGNKAEIKLQAFDILGSNKGYTRSVGDSNISTSYRNFMPRYFLLTFTYRISAYKKGGKQATQERNERGGFPGGGMGPGPGGFGGGFGGG